MTIIAGSSSSSSRSRSSSSSVSSKSVNSSPSIFSYDSNGERKQHGLTIHSASYSNAEISSKKTDSKDKDSEDKNSEDKVKITSSKEEMSSADKNDIMSYANSHPLERKQILRKIEDDVVNKNLNADEIKSDLTSTYGGSINDNSPKESEPGPDEDDLRDVNIDFQVNDFKQGSETDNSTLARLKAFASTENGAKALGNCITEDLMTNKVNVKLGDKTYSYTPQQIKEAQKTLSSGDDDVTVVEMAYQDYLKANGMSDADFLGTSDGSNLIDLISDKTKTTTESLQNKDYYGNSNIFKQYEFLNNKSKNPDKSSGTVTFNEDDSDNGITADRTYIIARVDKGNVILQDTSDTSKEVSINSQNFIKRDKTLNIYSDNDVSDSSATDSTSSKSSSDTTLTKEKVENHKKLTIFDILFGRS